MEIVRIFDENLFAIKHPGEAKDEFSRLFELWQDAERVRQYLMNLGIVDKDGVIEEMENQ
jgi:hypothetical protein